MKTNQNTWFLSKSGLFFGLFLVYFWFISGLFLVYFEINQISFKSSGHRLYQGMQDLPYLDPSLDEREKMDLEIISNDQIA